MAGFALLILIGCDNSRLTGDPGGVPVAFQVTVTRQFVRDLAYQRPGEYGLVYYPYPGYYHGFYHHRCYDPFYYPMWYGPPMYAPPPTTASLIGGDGPAQGRLFRKELDWGDNAFAVPILPGHAVTLTLQGYGERDGWEVVGAFTVEAGPEHVVTLDLSEHPAKMTLVGATPLAIPVPVPVSPPATAPPAPAP